MAQTKEERAVYMKEWGAANKEKIAAHHKKWLAENKEKVAAYQKEYNKTPKGRFQKHKANAESRGVEFLLTFDQWWVYWEPYWEQRGGLGHEMCMCRIGDVGPYAVGNVRIDTNSNNIKERHSVALYRQDST